MSSYLCSASLLLARTRMAAECLGAVVTTHCMTPHCPAGRRSLDRPIPIPLLPGRSAALGSQSYPGPDDEAGLLRKLLNRRRQSSAGTLPQQVDGVGWGGVGCSRFLERCPAPASSCAATQLSSPNPHPFPQQPLSSAQLRRNRDKLVALLEEGQYSLLEEAGSMGAPSPVPSPITTQVGGWWGRAAHGLLRSIGCMRHPALRLHHGGRRVRPGHHGLPRCLAFALLSLACGA